MDEERKPQQRMHPLFRLIIWVVAGLAVVGVVGSVVFMYLAHKDENFVSNAIQSLNKIADSLDEKERGGSAEKLRELGQFLQTHGDDIDEYGGDIDKKLSEIKEHSDSAYEAAKKKVDEYKKERAEKEEKE